MKRALAILLLLGGTAQAQMPMPMGGGGAGGGMAGGQPPMMMDPSRMSGIPRPDSQVPAKTVTVRLIRGNLQNRMPGIDVQLVDSSGATITNKSDAEGRATFANLSGGPFEARATDADGTQLKSQPIELPPEVGVRVMLVFPVGPNADDGLGRPDPKIPAGTLIAKVVDGDAKPLAGVEVVLGQATQGASQVKQIPLKTNAAGEARFADLSSDSNVGYLVEAHRDGARYPGKPFRMDSNHGSRLTIVAKPVSHDPDALQIASGSHFIVQVIDEAVQMVEVLLLENQATTEVEMADGIRIPLPAGAVQITLGQRSPPNLTVGTHELVWRGPLPTGQTQIEVEFAVPYHGDTLDLEQATPVAFANVGVVTEKIDGYSIGGPGGGGGLEVSEQPVQGRTILLARGPGAPRGGRILIELRGLPKADTSARTISAVLAILVLIGFGAYAVGAPSGAAERRRLMARREQLLATIEKEPAGSAAREKLTVELADIYRALDEEGV